MKKGSRTSMKTSLSPSSNKICQPRFWHAFTQLLTTNNLLGFSIHPTYKEKQMG
jgi:hypothetical protein